MINSNDAYSILNIEGNTILCKDGSISFIYLLVNPEPYSLDKNKLDLRHSAFIKGFRNLKNDTYIHQQTITTEELYSSQSHYKSESFLTKSEFKHFDNRKTINNYTLLSFTISNLNSLEEGYIANPFKYKESLTQKDQEELSIFFEAVSSCLAIIETLYNTKFEKLTSDEITYLFQEYVNGFHQDPGLRDLNFTDKLEIGENKFSAFSISDSFYLPEYVSNSVVDNSIVRESENIELQRGFIDDFGVNMPFNHIYNQVIHIAGHETLKKELETRLELFARNKTFKPSIENEHNRLQEITKSMLDNGFTLCKAHFSIITWDKNVEKLKKKEDVIKGIFANKEIKYYVPSFEGLYHLFIGTVMGRVSSLHSDYFFLTTIETALCFFTNYSFYQSDVTGTVFQDRILQTPIYRDLWDKKGKRMKARNQIWFSPTGGGKSATAQHIIQGAIEENINVIVAEFGNSFQHLTLLYPEISAHIKYDNNTPLGINPFDLNGSTLSSDKIISLGHVVLKFWRQYLDAKEETGVSSAVRKTIVDYYENVLIDHSFPSFYNYVKNNFQEIITRKEIPPKYFDVENFLHVCSDFLEGGIYENVCKGSDENENILKNKSFVVFELTGVQDDSFLTSVVLSILNDTVNEKILSDRSKRAYLCFDEFAKTQELKNEYSGDDIMSVVAHSCQTIRKENGAVILIYQSPDQMPDNHYSKNILANMQLLGVLQATELVYQSIVDIMKIKDTGHINQMKSIQNDFTSQKPHSEIFLRFNESYATVVKLEFSKEKLKAFQTEGAQWKRLQEEYQRTKDFEKAIINQINLDYEENNNSVNRFN